MILRLPILAALLLALAAPAAQSFPGGNGKVVYGWHSLDEPELGPPFHYDRSIRAIPPRGGTPRIVRGCAQTTGQPDVGDCTLAAYADPSVSRDGTQVVFDGGTSLAVMGLDAPNFHSIGSPVDDPGKPVFSPGGKRIAYSGDGISISDLGGSHYRRIVAAGVSPAWSLREQIAFLRSDGIYRVRPDGRGLKRLVARTRCTDVAWSPRGAKLAFACKDRLLVVDANGNHLHRVAGVTGAVDLAWSPDGKRFVLHEFDSGVRTIRTDGRGSRTLAAGGVNATSSFDANGVDWQPLR